MKYKLLLFFIMLVLNIDAQTQKHHFEVIHDGKPLGTLSAIKTNQGDHIQYTSHTSIEYSLLVAIKVVYDYNVSFINGILNEATARILVRGNDKTNVKTVKNGSAYQFYSESELKATITEPIKHSIIQLLFEEPLGITKIYAEEHGEFHALKKIADHVYLKTSPKGQKNVYYYKNGMLQKSDVNTGIIKFSIIRKD